MVKVKTDLLHELPENLYDRIRLYRKEGLKSHRLEVKGFRRLVFNGVVPLKCLICYESGFRFCRFWFEGFQCGQFENRLVDEQIERML